jgi:hypothetical protein
MGAGRARIFPFPFQFFINAYVSRLNRPQGPKILIFHTEGTNFSKAFDIQAQNRKKAPMILYISGNRKIYGGTDRNLQECRGHMRVAVLLELL